MISLGLGLGLALALDRPGQLYAFVRGAVFSAYVVSWVAVALLWMWILDADGGPPLHALPRGGHRPATNWLGDPAVALYTLAAVSVWKITGYSMVIFLAGLQDIPRSLARGRGARRRRTFLAFPPRHLAAAPPERRRSSARPA